MSCPHCHDTGWRTIPEDDASRVERCVCWREGVALTMLTAAGSSPRSLSCSPSWACMEWSRTPWRNARTKSGSGSRWERVARTSEPWSCATAWRPPCWASRWHRGHLGLGPRDRSSALRNERAGSRSHRRAVCDPRARHRYGVLRARLSCERVWIRCWRCRRNSRFRVERLLAASARPTVPLVP